MKRLFDRSLYAFVLTAAMLYITSCLKPPDYDESPTITFKSLSKTEVQEDSINVSDSLQLTFSFTDGDGDLGALNNLDSTLNIFLTDSRDNSIKEYQIPTLTPDGSVKAISGDITITIKSFACQPGFDTDPFTYAVKIKDRAGHESNTIQTDQITIDCL